MKFLVGFEKRSPTDQSLISIESSDALTSSIHSGSLSAGLYNTSLMIMILSGNPGSIDFSK